MTALIIILGYIIGGLLGVLICLNIIATDIHCKIMDLTLHNMGGAPVIFFYAWPILIPVGLVALIFLKMNNVLHKYKHKSIREILANGKLKD